MVSMHGRKLVFDELQPFLLLWQSEQCLLHVQRDIARSNDGCYKSAVAHFVGFVRGRKLVFDELQPVPLIWRHVQHHVIRCNEGSWK